MGESRTAVVEHWAWKSEVFVEGTGFRGEETADRNTSFGVGGIGEGLKMPGHPSPLQTKGEGFCFWQDQELKLKKRDEHQTRGEKESREKQKI